MDLRDVARQLFDQGKSKRAIAREIGKDESTIRRWLKEDPAVLGAMDTVNTDLRPQLVWIKNGKYSVLLKPQDHGFNEHVVRDMFKGIPAARKVPAPKHTNQDLLTAYPIFDLHLGMRSQRDLTGGDYDYDIAQERLSKSFATCMSLTPNSARGVIVNGGDFTHADDDLNVTPTSKHVLDVAGRNYETIEAGLQLLTHIIEMLLKKHEKVEYYSVPGNHDPKNWYILQVALRERYRDNPRVHIECSPLEFSVITHGQVLIGIHHGHRRVKWDDLILWFAAEYPEVWAQTRYRTLWLGHMHHRQRAEKMGVLVEQFSATSTRSSYEASHAYKSLPIFQSITFSPRGEILRASDLME